MDLRRVIPLVAAGVVAMGVLAGCADSGYHYVKNSDQKTYFKVPSEWTLYDTRDDLAVLDDPTMTEFERAQQRQGMWRVAFDGDPQPKTAHLTKLGAAAPWGMAIVRDMNFSEASSISDRALRNMHVPLDEALAAEQGKVVSYEELNLDGGLHGFHVVAKLLTAKGVVTIDQTSVLSQDRSTSYSLFLSCSTKCYEENEGRIESIVDSWTVKAK
jgi:hypothetical protein